ncbi:MULTISPECIES: M949_RS01915 family surface polysaccharide biosynthesis protein [unclassified Flavobacterium]|jgi:hypothetical protein|uniref:M949_RS01915 family surface polysaccharide biosynthesis protein n=1 Tax=unclassified Flavobacterium TaxID=196869 RepID=UPI00057E6E4E|nr:MULTISPECIES: hypothetical protein [unclassified Flavobacterium]KIC00068.1 hypothetical protein OA93_00160 [Flavobacterium sp. KMS]KIC02839.1 hypothetical protein OA88_06875 [Flavobacterium sp. JRM]MEA9411952.1 hypothetical protein [Flavobacterium sp. PL02]
MKNFILLFFFFYSTISFSQAVQSKVLSQTEITERDLDGGKFPIFRAYEYQDKGGVYELVLSENQKVISDKDTLNTKIEAVCYLNDHGGYIEKWKINDLIESAEVEETSIWFWTKYCSTQDLDDDGYIEPVLVYGTKTDVGDLRRIKIITLYKGKKYVIRAVECDLDYCRSFKKDKNWNSLPTKVKTHIDKLVVKIRKEQNVILADG